MPPAKKAVKKKIAATRKASAAQRKAEEELQWAKWEKRVTSIILNVLCLAAAFNELFLTDEPSEVRLVFIASVFGVNIVLSGRSSAPK